MPFTPKTWQNAPSTATPINASSLIDLEQRLAGYAETFETSLPPVWTTFGDPGVGGRMTDISVSPYDSNRVLVAGDMLGVGVSEDAGSSWQTSTGFLSWEMDTFTWDPSDSLTVWVGSMSGPFKSIDGGHTWVSKRNGMSAISSFPYSQPISQVFFDPADQNHMLAFGGNSRLFKAAGPSSANGYGKVYESNDAGDTWTLKSTILTDGNIMRAIISPDFQTIYAVVVSNGVYKSTNGGSTWAQVNNGFPHLVVFDVEAEPNFATIYAALRYGTASPYAAGGIYKTTDGGANWVAANTGLPQVVSTTATSSSSFYPITRSPDGTLYTADQAFPTQKLYKSVDQAATWVQMNVAITGKFFPAGASPTAYGIDSKNPSTIYAVTSDTMYKTNDAGATWFDTGNRTVSGKTSGRGYSGVLGTRILYSPAKKGLVITNGFDAGNFLRTEDGGQSWTRPTSLWDNYTGGYESAFAGPTSDIVYTLLGQAGVFNGIGVSTDAGKTFSVKVGAPLPSRYAGGGRSTVGICAGSKDGATAYAAITTGVVFKTTDTGATWTSHFTTASAGAVVCSKDFSTVYIGTVNGVYSGNGGGTYTLMSGSPKATRLVMGPDGTLFAVAWTGGGAAGGLWKYSGGVWTQLAVSTYIRDVAIDPYEPLNIAYVEHQDPFRDVSQATGVWKSEDGGATFIQKNDGLPMTRGYSIAFDPFDPGMVSIGTTGRGFWKTRLFDTQAAAPLSALRSYVKTEDLPELITPAPTVSGGVYDGSLSASKYVENRDQAVRTPGTYTFPGGSTGVRGQRFIASSTATVPASDGRDGYVVSLQPIAQAGATYAKGVDEIKLRVNGAGVPQLVTGGASPYYAPGINSLTQLSHPMHTWSYDSNDTFVWVNCWTRAGGKIRLRVDGEYVGLAPTDVGGGNAFVNFACDFGAEGAKTRRIEWEMYHGCFMSSVFTGPTGIVSLAKPFPGLSLYVLGDSFIDGSFGQYPGFEDMAHITAARLGIEKVTVDALGGTGYVKTNDVSVFPNYQTRIANNIKQCQPDIVLVCGSINDGTGVTSPSVNIPPAAQNVFNSINANAPNAKIFVVTFSHHRFADGTIQTGVAQANAAVQSVATTHPAVVAYRDLSYLLTGWGRQGSETGSGTSDILVSSDNAHPTPVAHEIFSREIAGMIETGLEGGVQAPFLMPVAGNGPAVADTMSGADGQTVTAHGLLINSGLATTDMVIDTNRLRRNANVTCFAYYNATIAADSFMESDMMWFSRLSGNGSGLILRGSTTADTGIWFHYNVTGGSWRIMDVVAGTGTQIGSSYVNSPSGLVSVRAEVQGTTAKLYLDGVVRITATTTITGSGKAAIRDSASANIPATGTGAHYDNVVAGNYP